VGDAITVRAYIADMQLNGTTQIAEAIVTVVTAISIKFIMYVGMILICGQTAGPLWTKLGFFTLTQGVF